MEKFDSELQNAAHHISDNKHYHQGKPEATDTNEMQKWHQKQHNGSTDTKCFHRKGKQHASGSGNYCCSKTNSDTGGSNGNSSSYCGFASSYDWCNCDYSNSHSCSCYSSSDSSYCSCSCSYFHSCSYSSFLLLFLLLLLLLSCSCSCSRSDSDSFSYS